MYRRLLAYCAPYWKVFLAAALANAGYHFVATPGTAAALRRLGYAVREVAMPA